MKHFTCVSDIGDLKAAVAEALEVKKTPYAWGTLGQHKTMLLVFFDSSLRTRLSTQKAAMNLGMNTIVLDVNQGAWKLETERGVVMDGDKPEHMLEAIPVMGSYCDLMGVRSFARFESREADYRETVLQQFIRHSGKPVVSMEAATRHPLQSFADLITIEEYKKTARPKVVLTWAPHPRALPQAVPNSFAEWMNAAGYDFVITHPEGYELAPEFVGSARVEYNQRNAFEGADFIYAKSWAAYTGSSYGKVLSKDRAWTVDTAKMALTNNARFMHCLPVRRNMIVTDDVIESPQSIVIPEAANRVVSAQTVIKRVLEGMHTLKTAALACTLQLLAAAAALAQPAPAPAVLTPADFKHHVDYFNRMEPETVVQAVPNAEAWSFLQKNIPLFTCPQDNIEQLYYFRWWALRKHLRQTADGYVFTEFLVERSYADRHNMISSGLGHHILELRWLHAQQYLSNYVRVWYRGNDGAPLRRLRAFSSWTAYALLHRYYVSLDGEHLANLLPDLEAEYRAWEQERRLPGGGLFWQFDVRDAMEESLSGARKEQNARPSINSYMYGNARAIAAAAALAGNAALQQLFSAKADTLKTLVEQRLWNAPRRFFEVRKEADTLVNAREAIGYMPWYTNMVSADTAYNDAWRQAIDTDGFLAPYGLTTAERRHPQFRAHGCCRETLGACCQCEWDGAVWPFATAQTMTGMANFMSAQPRQRVLTAEDYFTLFERYVEAQHHRGRPYIGEYHDEVTGYWLKGDQERSRYYNHSTFADLLITGLVGLRPRPDGVLEVSPLIPQERWDWFCLDNVLYHGKTVTILWDKTGKKFNHGAGFRVLVNGKEVAKSGKLERVEAKL